MNRAYSRKSYEKEWKDVTLASTLGTLSSLFARLVARLRCMMLALASTRAYTAVVAIGAVMLVLLTLGIAGGVESGRLPFMTLVPTAFAWPCAAFLLHLSRK